MRKYCIEGFEGQFPEPFLYWLKNLEHNWYATNQHSIMIERLTGMPRKVDLFPLVIAASNLIVVGNKQIEVKHIDDDLRDRILEALDESRGN